MTVAELLKTGNVREATENERGSLFSIKWADTNFIYEVKKISKYEYMLVVNIDDGPAFSSSSYFFFFPWNQIQPLTEEEAEKILSQA